jgi:hypothetical protein
MMGIHSGHKHPAVFLSVALLCAVPCAITLSAKTPAPAASGAADQKQVQVSIPALLDTALDSKKRNAGDEVQAKTVAPVTLADGTVIARGAKVIGHVAEAKALGKGDGQSSLTIAFDKITTPDGKTVNIKGHIQAVGPNPNAGQSNGGVDYGGSMNRSMQHSGPGQDTYAQIPVLNEQSAGVEGIKNLGLSDDGTLTSGEKSVKLEHNAQLVLRAQIVPGQ